VGIGPTHRPNDAKDNSFAIGANFGQATNAFLVLLLHSSENFDRINTDYTIVISGLVAVAAEQEKVFLSTPLVSAEWRIPARRTCRPSDVVRQFTYGHLKAEIIVLSDKSVAKRATTGGGGPNL